MPLVGILRSIYLHNADLTGISLLQHRKYGYHARLLLDGSLRHLLCKDEVLIQVFRIDLNLRNAHYHITGNRCAIFHLGSLLSDLCHRLASLRPGFSKAHNAYCQHYYISSKTPHCFDALLPFSTENLLSKLTSMMGSGNCDKLVPAVFTTNMPLIVPTATLRR